MGVAPWVAEVLERQGVLASFFLANEKTLSGGSSLDDTWAPWWRQMAARGHAFGSHTWDHWVWQSDQSLPGGGTEFRVRPTAGDDAGQRLTVTAAAYCEQLQRPAQRFQAMTGQPLGGVFRAPAGRTSPALLAEARRCGFEHVPWSAAGFLGDELSSEKYTNAFLLKRALQTIQPGDILLAHLGIWSRQDPWAPAVLEPLLQGLKKQGYCFATLREHPRYRGAWAGSALRK
jgi:peptidoglycan/xylan/chitin deacetylase (PgdA/CDA1 family)